MEQLFQGVFDATATSIQLKEFVLCMGSALVIGIFLAAVYTYKNNYSQSFILALALFPAVVCVVIMMVNGNVGAGIAVAGAFSLVRFRSAQGTAKEIVAIFLGMGTGLITGMGYIAYAVVFAVIVSAVMVLYTMLGIGLPNKVSLEKILHITIPENLDYETVFDEIMEEYTNSYELINVKTSNMGSLFKLTYHICFKEQGKEKEFLDKIRTRNGNLEIAVSRNDRNQEAVL